MSSSKVFISYSRSDYLNDNNEPIKDSAIKAILDSLESNGIDTWIDTHDTYSSSNFSSVLAKRILWADKIIFISSKNSNSSKWVCQEILYAHENKKDIIPIKIDDTPFSENFALILSGIDYIEYYKNASQATKKAIKLLTNGDAEISTHSPTSNYSKIKKLKFIGSCLLVLLCTFCIFATIGFAVGYFNSRTDVVDTMNEAFRNHQVTAVNPSTIQFSGKTMKFTFDVESNHLMMENESSNFFDNVTFEKMLVAISIPAAFENLFKMSKSAGNGKSKAVFLIVGSIGIICGYAIGEPLGKEYALYKNEKELQDFLMQDQTKTMVKQQLSMIFQ